MKTSFCSPRTRTNQRRSPDSSSRTTAATTGLLPRWRSSQASMRVELDQSAPRGRSCGGANRAPPRPSHRCPDPGTAVMSHRASARTWPDGRRGAGDGPARRWWDDHGPGGDGRHVDAWWSLLDPRRRPAAGGPARAHEAALAHRRAPCVATSRSPPGPRPAPPCWRRCPRRGGRPTRPGPGRRRRPGPVTGARTPRPAACRSRRSHAARWAGGGSSATPGRPPAPRAGVAGALPVVGRGGGRHGRRGPPLFPGAAGENLSVSRAGLGELRPGTRLASVRPWPRSPSRRCRARMNSRWFLGGNHNRMHHERVPGESRLYALVLVPGHVAVGDPAIVEPADPAGRGRSLGGPSVAAGRPGRGR